MGSAGTGRRPAWTRLLPWWRPGWRTRASAAAGTSCPAGGQQQSRHWTQKASLTAVAAWTGRLGRELVMEGQQRRIRLQQPQLQPEMPAERVALLSRAPAALEECCSSGEVGRIGSQRPSSWRAVRVGQASVVSNCMPTSSLNVCTHSPSLPALASIQQHPVVHAVLWLVRLLEDLGEELSEEVIVWRLLEAKLAHVVQVDAEPVCNPRRSNCISQVAQKCSARQIRPTHLGSPLRAP